MTPDRRIGSARICPDRPGSGDRLMIGSRSAFDRIAAGIASGISDPGEIDRIAGDYLALSLALSRAADLRRREDPCPDPDREPDPDRLPDPDLDP